MTTAYICLLIAGLMPYFLTGYAKFSVKGYDNSQPREFLSKLEGKGKRAHAAHLNSFEAFPFFAVSVILAQLTGVSHGLISVLAVFFILFRLQYCIFYIQDKPNLRSAVWFGGFFCVMTLLINSILKTL